jgi:hypothetical protein
MKAEFNDAVSNLKDQHEKLLSRLSDVSITTGTNWETEKSDLESSIARLRNNIRDVTDRFDRSGSMAPAPRGG